MRGVFDDREFEQAEAQSETELTLGSATLLLIAFGLALLCGLCFGFGYAAGHRGAQPSVASLPSPDVSAVLNPGNGPPKPSADAQPAPAITSTDAEPDDQPSSSSSVSAPAQQNQESSLSATESNQSFHRPACGIRRSQGVAFCRFDYGADRRRLAGGRR
jgi:DedD protein